VPPDTAAGACCVGVGAEAGALREPPPLDTPAGGDVGEPAEETAADVAPLEGAEVERPGIS
jgi:hypothetical protein